MNVSTMLSPAMPALLPEIPAADRRASLVLAAQVFAMNRLLLIAVSWITGKLFYDVRGRDHTLGALWHRWDVQWYVHLADHGYRWYAPPTQSNLAFFPLYPLGMHLLSRLFSFSAYSAGLLISNLSFLAALYLLHRLVLHDYDPETAERAVLYLGLFPTALFFFTAYSEALYLLCCLGCVYALRLRRWWLAGLCGMAAALTRQLGLLLVVPFILEYLDSRTMEIRHDRRGLFALALIPAGLLAFMAYLQITLGNGLLFLRAQQAWGRAIAWPWQGIARDVAYVLHPEHPLSPITRAALRTIGLLDLAFVALFCVLILIGARRLRPSYTAYAGALFLAVLISPVLGPGQPLALMSASRFMATLFPPFIVLALLGRQRAVDRAVLTGFVGLLVLFAIVFVRGRWIA